MTLFSRNGLDLTGGEPGVVAALASLPDGDFVVDGELVVFGKDGVPRFSLLQKRGEAGRPSPEPHPVRLSREGRGRISCRARSPRGAPRSNRSSAAGRRNRSPSPSASGRTARRRSRARARKGWEGIVGKDLASRYEAGRRSLRWLKVKARKESEFVIGGFTLPRGTRLHFGALLVGLYEGKALRFCGAVGTGFSEEVLLGLLEKLHPLQRDACPFAAVPREVKDAAWVAPKLVAQVAYAEWTGDEKLRQPAFLGLRNDKKPSECRWEEERDRKA